MMNITLSNTIKEEPLDVTGFKSLKWKGCEVIKGNNVFDVCLKWESVGGDKKLSGSKIVNDSKKLELNHDQKKAFIEIEIEINVEKVKKLKFFLDTSKLKIKEYEYILYFEGY